MEELEQNKPKVRTLLRIFAGFVTLVCVFNVFSSIGMIRAGYYEAISSLLIGIVFGGELGLIAIRGDGLFLYNSERMAKRKKQREGVRDERDS